MKKSSRLTWVAHQHEYKERGADWFWAVGIVTVAAAVAATIFGNLILGILIIVGAFALTLFINRDADAVEVVVDERGVTRGEIHYPYASLHSFWVEMEHVHPKIYLRSQKVLLPLIMVPLGEADGHEVAEFLAEHLTEEHHQAPFVERLLERLGF